jgi:hypothetical protein
MGEVSSRSSCAAATTTVADRRVTSAMTGIAYVGAASDSTAAHTATTPATTPSAIQATQRTGSRGADRTTPIRQKPYSIARRAAEPVGDREDREGHRHAREGAPEAGHQRPLEKGRQATEQQQRQEQRRQQLGVPAVSNVGQRRRRRDQAKPKLGKSWSHRHLTTATLA